jgi:hypothetical protein
VAVAAKDELIGTIAGNTDTRKFPCCRFNNLESLGKLILRLIAERGVSIACSFRQYY